jgi:hypothetical protein
MQVACAPDGAGRAAVVAAAGAGQPRAAAGSQSGMAARTAVILRISCAVRSKVNGIRPVTMARLGAAGRCGCHALLCLEAGAVKPYS